MPIETSNQCMSAEAKEAKSLLGNGLSCRADADILAQFQVGDWVKAKVMHPKPYTRFPRYARGKVGKVIKQVDPNLVPSDRNRLRA